MKACVISTIDHKATMQTRRVSAPLAGRVAFVARRDELRGRAGFTLVEAMIASAVLAIAMIAIGGSLSATVQQSAVVEQDSTALLLARELMEEITAKPYMDPDSGTITTATVAAANQAAARAASLGSTIPPRASYNDVGDYNGYSDTIDSTHLATSLQGSTASVTNNRSYTRSVSIQFSTTVNGSAVTSGDYALITVTVTAPDGHCVQISRLATNTTLMQQ